MSEMKTTDWLQLLAYLAALLVLTPLLGGYMARVFAGKCAWLAPVERLIYKLSGLNPAEEMRWTGYCGALLVFNLLGMLAVLGLQLAQQWLPANPQHVFSVVKRTL